MRHLNLLWLIVIWGSYYILNRIALSFVNVEFAGLTIRAVTFFVMLGYMVLRGEFPELFKIKYVFPRLLLIGFFGFMLDITAFVGFKYSTASKGSVLLRSDVMFSALIGRFFGQRVSIFEILVILFMLFGIALVSGEARGLLKISIWDTFFLLSAFFISLNAFVIRTVQDDKRNPATDNVIGFYNNLFTFVFFLTYTLLTGRFKNLGAELEGLSKALPLFALTGAGVFQFLIYVFYYDCLRRYPVWLVRSILLVMPVYVSTFSFIFLGERLKAFQIFGMMIVLLGAFVLTLALYPKREATKKSLKGER